MQLFFSHKIDPEATTYTFSREESKHIIRVLRKLSGDTINITNGKGYLFSSSIVDENPNKCTVVIDKKEYHKPAPYYLHMAVAPTKLNDRFEWFLEKATEIGISEITPLLCDHSERKNIKLDRYNKILQSALKQSLQYHLPKLNALTSFKDFLESTKNTVSLKCITHCEEGDKIAISKLVSNTNHATILIGPEGDFSTQEIQNAVKQQYKQVTLGENRLRTETAAILACSAVSLLQS